MKKISVFLIIFLIFPAGVFARRGCCSHHGGVAGCSPSGRQICADGTLSPSCTCTPTPVYGCTDYKAKNYNASANKDDGSCLYDVLGCTDVTAQNYNPAATKPNGSCLYVKNEIITEEIKYETIYIENESLTAKDEIKKQEGKNGQKEFSYEITLDEKKKEVKRELISEKIALEPVNAIIERNSKAMDQEKSDNSFFILWIICNIFNYVYMKKISEVNCIFARLRKTTRKKVVKYFIYYFTIIPTFIDSIIILAEIIRKKKKNEI